MRIQNLVIWAGISSLLLGVSSLPCRAREWTLDERVAARKAVERVSWSHRLWPKENRDAKPRLDAVLPDEAIRARVEDSLAKSNALESLRRTPISSDELQAELERMARHTKDPDRLRELFAALENDPELIAETIAREKLADRLLRSWYTADDRFHGTLRRNVMRAVARLSRPAEMTKVGGSYQETTWRRLDSSSTSGGAIPVEGAQWDELREEISGRFGAQPDEVPVGRTSRVRETDEGFTVIAVLKWEPEQVTVATVSWPKRSFDSWWAGERARHLGPVAATHGSYHTVNIEGSGCVNDTWRPLPYERPDLRTVFSVVWTGSEMIVWGGMGETYLLNSGARYDPSTDTWTPTSMGPGVASPRQLHTAVWTGTEMIVWGGVEYDTSTSSLDTGARYNPITEVWTPLPTGAPAPSRRHRHTAVWTGTEMIIWGGFDGTSQYLGTGSRYNRSSNSWTATSTSTDNPTPRYDHSAVWTGSEMIIWGGVNSSSTALNSGGRYNPVANSWTAVPLAPFPGGRSGHPAFWTGTEMIVWGGETGSNIGSRYNPSTNSWTNMSAVGSPSIRVEFSAVWTGTEMIIWGGSFNSNYDNGARYNPSTNSWIPLLLPDGVVSPRAGHRAVWTGTEMIVWGDRHALEHESMTGGRYNVDTGRWVPVATGSGPATRVGHFAFWTGTEMLVWGVHSPLGGIHYRTGGRYDPALDSWTPTSTLNTPDGNYAAVWTGHEMIAWASDLAVRRYDPLLDLWTSGTAVNAPALRGGASAVWTGSEMIVWGGSSGGTNLNTGGRYDPASNIWTSTSTAADVPSARTSPKAVWTGREMIVWGGYDSSAYLASGGRYDPLADTWKKMPTAGAPSPRIGHTAVWTGHELIVWGGRDASTYFADGARFFPDTNSWGPVAPAQFLLPRAYHTAVWTGKEMTIWGGEVAGNYGARYDPAADSWIYTVTGDYVPSDRSRHSAVWTGKEMIIWGGTPPTLVSSAYCIPSSCLTAPGEVNNLQFERLSESAALLSWTPSAGALGHDIVRGLLAELPVGAGGGDTSESCWWANVSPPVSETAVPASGAGFWYVVRGDNACGQGSFGNARAQGGASVPRVSDACP